MQKRYKSVFFDLDGTLINSSRDIATAVNETLKELGCATINVEDIFAYIGNGIEKLLSRSLGKSIYGDSEFEFPAAEIREKVDILRGYYRKHMLDTTRPYAGIPELLAELKKEKVFLGVITNKPLFYSKEILDKLDLARYFRLIYGGDSFPERKPHPMPLIEAIKESGFSPAQTLMTGDSPVDIIMGRAAGTNTCAVTWGIRTRSELKKENPDFIADKVEELYTILNHRAK